MRSLRRARRARLPSPVTSVAHHAEELRTIKRRERIGVLRAMTLGGFLLIVAAVLAWSAHGRIVSEGLVEANLVEVRAPGRVRIEEVLIAPGQRFRRGERLFVLSALGADEERRALELEREHAALRLSLAEAGGDLGEVDLDRRLAATEDAEREWRLADARLTVVEAGIEILERRRATIEAALEREVKGLESEAARLEDEIPEERALAARAAAAEQLAQYDVESRTALKELGAGTQREVAEAEARREQHAREREGREAAARGLELRAARLREEVALERGRAEAELEQLAAELDEARAALTAARVRRDQWRQTTLRRRILAANGPENVARLRRLELELLRKDLERTELRLASFDARVGNTTVLAETDGVCDQLLVTPGSVADEEALLATHYDPSTRRVVAYVGPGGAEELAIGRVCSVTPLKGDESHWGRVTAVAGAWVPRPAAIPGRIEPSEDRRLAFRLGLSRLPDFYRPGMRVTVVFDRDEDGAAEDRQAEAEPFHAGALGRSGAGEPLTDPDLADTAATEFDPEPGPGVDTERAFTPWVRDTPLPAPSPGRAAAVVPGAGQ